MLRGRHGFGPEVAAIGFAAKDVVGDVEDGLAFFFANGALGVVTAALDLRKVFIFLEVEDFAAKAGEGVNQAGQDIGIPFLLVFRTLNGLAKLLEALEDFDDGELKGSMGQLDGVGIGD